MAQPWAMKALSAMTADEVRAALGQLPYLRPEDAALEKALRDRLTLALEAELPAEAALSAG
ncbi:hypothetical protein [Streptomonospora wellingtoniae]|uniref:Uncharacterized protein n=1 Tax=Streptomonospora wellingtoniae TaxID=3075544 RepID=A0ABU2KXI2_9ACTN|nr:hypothetical protein [Streptomonospora sp. DSM 45055]MDT0303960.1 hypothetical protein [Streptomonospora sp. DSM 45055]